jgi:hypothetical protein
MSIVQERNLLIAPRNNSSRVGDSNHVCCLFKERNGIFISLLAVTPILSQLRSAINSLLVFLRQALKVVGSLFKITKIRTC